MADDKNNKQLTEEEKKDLISAHKEQYFPKDSNEPKVSEFQLDDSQLTACAVAKMIQDGQNFEDVLDPTKLLEKKKEAGKAVLEAYEKNNSTFFAALAIDYEINVPEYVDELRSVLEKNPSIQKDYEVFLRVSDEYEEDINNDLSYLLNLLNNPDDVKDVAEDRKKKLDTINAPDMDKLLNDISKKLNLSEDIQYISMNWENDGLGKEKEAIIKELMEDKTVSKYLNTIKPILIDIRKDSILPQSDNTIDKAFDPKEILNSPLPKPKKKSFLDELSNETLKNALSQYFSTQESIDLHTGEGLSNHLFSMNSDHTLDLFDVTNTDTKKRSVLNAMQGLQNNFLDGSAYLLHKGEKYPRSIRMNTKTNKIEVGNPLNELPPHPDTQKPRFYYFKLLFRRFSSSFQNQINTYERKKMEYDRQVDCLESYEASEIGKLAIASIQEPAPKNLETNNKSLSETINTSIQEPAPKNVETNNKSLSETINTSIQEPALKSNKTEKVPLFEMLNYCLYDFDFTINHSLADQKEELPNRFHYVLLDGIPTSVVVQTWYDKQPNRENFQDFLKSDEYKSKAEELIQKAMDNGCDVVVYAPNLDGSFPRDPVNIQERKKDMTKEVDVLFDKMQSEKEKALLTLKSGQVPKATNPTTNLSSQPNKPSASMNKNLIEPEQPTFSSPLA